MLEKVANNIEKLIVRFPGGMREMNSYLINGENGYTVIDTGMNSEEAISIWKQVLETGLVIEKVVLTHTHEDHIGLAKWFQKHVGVPVFTSKLGYKEMLKNRDSTRIRQQLDSLIKKHGGPGVPEGLRNDPSIYDFEPDGFFEEHHKIQLGNEQYKVIWAPGHAPDQYCFYNEESKVMIVGDHILNDISPVIGLWTGEERNPLKEYYQSLKHMENYSTAIALPGHGVDIQDFHQRVKELRERHDHRLEQVLVLLQNDWKTANQICEEIYGKYDFKRFLSPFMAILTRLIYLDELGKVERIEKNGKCYFRAILF